MHFLPVTQFAALRLAHASRWEKITNPLPSKGEEIFETTEDTERTKDFNYRLDCFPKKYKIGIHGLTKRKKQVRLIFGIKNFPKG